MSLSICFLARNKEQSLQHSFDSIKDLADEIIVVDTGSTDKTRQIAQQTGAKVLSLSWKDDFSAAKNLALEQATSDWILFLKPGETIAVKDKQKIKEKINNKDNKDGKEMSAYILFRRNYTNNKNILDLIACDGSYDEERGYAGFIATPQLSLFRNHKDIRYEGVIFEDIEHAIIKNKGRIAVTNIMTHFVDVTANDPKKNAERINRYLKICLKEIEKNPKEPKYHYEVAKLYKMQQKFDDAMHHFKKSLQLQERYRNPHRELADIHLQQGKILDALEEYEAALQQKPQDLSTLLQLGSLYGQRGRYKDAVRMFQKALELNLRNPVAYQNLASTLVRANNIKGALKILEIAYEKTKLDKFKKMKEDLESKIEKNEKIKDALKEKDFVKVEQLLKGEILKNPKSLVAVTNLGAFYAIKKDNKKIVELLSPIVDGNKTDNSGLMMNLYGNLASAHAQLKDKKAALQILKQALKLKPSNSEFFEKKMEELKTK
ncbi:tetratricopeptide repeat protein [Candidatus Woesearchaeota archaeon]|nr:tetratricopeptide repeat protein [Candidatus Woesearchaeota archaeon]